jgi:hypothetical protein
MLTLSWNSPGLRAHWALQAHMGASGALSSNGATRTLRAIGSSEPRTARSRTPPANKEIGESGEQDVLDRDARRAERAIPQPTSVPRAELGHVLSCEYSLPLW